MKGILGVVLLLVGCSAVPMRQVETIVGEARSDDGTVITLLDAPCTSKTVLDKLKPQAHKLFKATRSLYEGALHESCWAEPEEDVVFIMWDDGGYFAAPKAFFKPPV